MRVIAGSARGRRLVEFTGRTVRPTPDRVREALFSILQSRISQFCGLRVLDLFAGSGALAIEALSRGAASAYLVEKAPASATIIRENLELCRLSDRAVLLKQDVLRAWPQISVAAPFDLIFLDPPYGQGLATQAMQEIAEREILVPAGFLSVETAANEELPAEMGDLSRMFQRRYGTVMISLYTHQ